MKKTTFEFKPREGKYVFIMDTEDIHREETVTKDYVKQHYNELIGQRAEMFERLKVANKDVERHKVEKDDELEHFIALANRAADYHKMLKAQELQKSTLDMIERVEESIKHIETTLPELKRQKK